MMNHPAEIKLHKLLQDVSNGEGDISDEILDLVAADVKAALRKQINSRRRNQEFTLRMSNIGRPKCQLWFDKNKPEEATPLPPFFMMQMLIGDVTEAVFKGLLRAANVDFEDSGHVTLNVGGQLINGTYDVKINGAIDDVKSASPWSYNNKFDSYASLAENDSFGYVSQLVGYAEADNAEVGGWWVINKSTGEFKYLKAEPDKAEAMAAIERTVESITNNEPLERCYLSVPETFYKKATGNLVLPDECHFCQYKKACWPMLRSIPKLVTRESTKNPAPVDYVYIAPEYEDKAREYENAQ